MNKKYYYPISSTSLASIFGQACILPASLYINRIPDIQSKFENFILLTDRFGVLGSDCCIEIMLTREEEESLIDIKESFFFYEKAIPVSRIKKIYFEKEVQALRTISNITLSTAFIPKHIIANGNHTFDHVNINNIVIPNELVDSINVVKTSYDTYNRILGALALMKTAHKDGCNVSPFYIDTLSKFNKLIEIQKKSVFEINTKFHSIIDNPLPLLKQIIDSNILNEIALKEKQQILKSKITNVIDPSNLDGITYICYVLYNYGVGEESRRRKIDELILNNFTGLKRAKEEACAFYYGYNRGYAVFNNQYRGENKTEIVKFQLNSLLDYYTIESIFEYSFNNIVPSNLSIIDSWFKPTYSKQPKKNEYMILDTIIRDKNKVPLFSEEWWTYCIQTFLPKDNFTFLGHNFSTTIMQMVLKPFAKYIQAEIEDEYNEELSANKDNVKVRISELETLLSNYRQQIEMLQSELDNNKSNQRKVLSTDSETNTIAESTKNVIVAKPQNMEYLDFDLDHIIELCLKNKTELKKYAKELGCIIKKGKDIDSNVIKEILKAEKNNIQKLF